MSFNWEEYIKLANKLSQKEDESSLRTAISRAYYGVFCIARNKKGYKNPAFRKGKNIHWIVINAYKNSAQSADRRIGKVLDSLRRRRNNADYDEDKEITRKMAQKTVLQARDILGNLK